MITPEHRKVTVTRHEWMIGDENSEYGVARTLADGILMAEKKMKELGVDLSYDDAYRFRAGNGGSIVLYVEIEEKS